MTAMLPYMDIPAIDCYESSAVNITTILGKMKTWYQAAKA